MFAIHAKVEDFKSKGKPIGVYTRPYYDLHCLASRQEVLTMLESEEYGHIKTDYDRVSRENFPKSYVPPPGMKFSKSDALFPPPALRTVLAAEFEKQCKALCFGSIPTWDDLQARLDSLRTLL
jgi:hypothetical protein